VSSHTTVATSGELDAMRRALEIATHGPAVGENPRVGCVLLSPEGEILAEGFHRGAGNPHAEVEALTALAETGTTAEGTTAVVTLEPCNHQGKTGPCAQALIDARVARVVYAASDPGQASAGGANTLRDAGVDVAGGVLAEEAFDLNLHWMMATSLGRPFVTAKWAQSLDGRHAADDGTSQWITGPLSRERVHRQRSEHGAIMVGTTTALVDNPSLTARDGDGLYGSQPLAVVMGERDIPADAIVRNHPGGFTQLATRDPKQALGTLFEQGIRSVYIEGGATLTSAFIKEGLVDSLQITMGPLLIGGANTAITDIGVSTLIHAPRLTIESVEQLDQDIWVSATPVRKDAN
jgi:diaminohydroxyphosphoribosylaminopyrimidine deaminase/5-amino-6-(5-phosphoribosylamino)uracil reductase